MTEQEDRWPAAMADYYRKRERAERAAAKHAASAAARAVHQELAQSYAAARLATQQRPGSMTESTAYSVKRR
jgi:hypothetical protein